MALTIRLLGEFELLSAQAESSAITARKARALLAYLCVKAGRPQQRENLARLLWGDVSQEDHARKSLRQALSVLRRELPAHVIDATRDELSLNPDAAFIDVREFERLAASPDPRELTRCVELYRGDLLEGFHSRADAFDDWILGERQRLRQLAIVALDRLLEAQRAEHDIVSATHSAIRIVSLDPLREASHRNLMQLYAEQGRLGDALDQYENCRQVLLRELGRGPEASTAELLQHLRQHRDAHASHEASQAAEPIAQLRVVAVLAAIKQTAEANDEAAMHRIKSSIEEQGGLLLRRTSRSILAVFGALRSIGSEAARAAAAARRAAEGAKEYGFGVSLAQAMVAQMDGSINVVGEAISQAAHLAGIAELGSLAVSESVRQALRGGALAREVSWTPKRDGSGRIQAWLVSECPSCDSNPLRHPFVGRARELDVLRSALNACLATKTGQLLRIRGEAGIGKTRLLEELLSMATREGFHVVKSAALDFGRRSERDAIAQLTRALMQSSASYSPEVRGHLEDTEPASTRDHGLLLELAALDATAPREAAEQSERQARADRQRELWLELWQRALDDGPMLVAIEDLHWVEQPAFDYLAALLGLVQDRPLLLVVSSRPRMAVQNPSWLGALSRCAVLSLDLCPMSADEGRQLAAQLSISDSVHIEAAIERSEGHPLFLEQMLRARRPAHLTPSIQVGVQTRLDELASPEAGALRAAAVLGQQFDVNTLTELLECDVPTPGLLRSGLIQRVGSRFMFSHALIRDAVYETLPPAAQRRLHQRAADVVRHQDLTLCAEHLERAKNPQAAQAYLEAADSADRRDRVSEALGLAERGLGLTADSSLSFLLMLARVRLLGRLGQSEAQEQGARDALAVATTGTQRTRAWVALAECLRGTPRDSEALSALQTAEQAAAPDDHETRSHIHYLRGNVLFPRAESDACLTAHKQALEHAKLAGSSDAEARALSGLGDAYYTRGDLPRALTHFEAGAALADQLSHTRLARVNRVMAELVRLFCLDRPGRAFDAMMAHAELAREELDLPGEAVARSSALYATQLRGNPSALENAARQVIDVSRRSGRQRLGLAAAAWMLEARMRQGIEVDADQELETIYAHCAGPDVPFAALNLLASMIACCKDAKRRASLYEEAERILSGGQFVSHCLYNFSRSALIECLQADDHDRLEHYAERLESYTQPHGVAWGSFFCTWARTLSAWRRGHRDDAAKSDLLALKKRASELGLPRESELLEVFLHRQPFARPPARG